LAIKAFKQALSMSLSPRTVLLVAGDGPQKVELQDLIEQLDLSGHVHLLGWCQPPEIKALLSISNILVHPALWDPYPNVILEAIAWRLPVLASDQTMSAVDRVKPGLSGFIHHVGDVTELAKQMAYFLENPAEIKKMGARARLTAEEWPASRNVQTILDLVKKYS
jgi:glycosyltransferase involved in cell wall biosynthesis